MYICNAILRIYRAQNQMMCTLCTCVSHFLYGASVMYSGVRETDRDVMTS